MKLNITTELEQQCTDMELLYLHDVWVYFSDSPSHRIDYLYGVMSCFKGITGIDGLACAEISFLMSVADLMVAQ